MRTIIAATILFALAIGLACSLLLAPLQQLAGMLPH
jgi:hypothetical protein